MIHVLKTIQIVPRGYTDIHGSHQTVYMPTSACAVYGLSRTTAIATYLFWKRNGRMSHWVELFPAKQGCYEAWTRFSVLLDLLKQQQRT